MLMPFGKHRGCYVEDLPQSYLRWLLDNVDLREPLLTEVCNALVDYDPSPVPSTDKVRIIYRELAFKWHPDRGGSTEAMQALNEFHDRLYEVT